MTQTVNDDSAGRSSSTAVLIATSLTLFSMFFGAGNLIFPPIMGASAGTNFGPAMIGFLIGGVALPVISIITIALSGTDMRDLVSRAGKPFGIVFSVMVYLSIGAFYALPRTGAVSFSTAIAPLIGTKSLTASIIFSFIFFGIAFYLCWNPGKIIDNLGKILTPVLLGLLVLLVFLCLASLPASHDAPTGEYASTPLAAGLLEGYMTMDSIAALAFGIIVVTSLGHTGGGIGAKVLRRTSMAAVIAGFLLAVVYVGLGLIGHVIPNAQSYSDGATLLADAAQMTMGWPGQIVDDRLHDHLLRPGIGGTELGARHRGTDHHLPVPHCDHHCLPDGRYPPAPPGHPSAVVVPPGNMDDGGVVGGDDAGARRRLHRAHRLCSHVEPAPGEPARLDSPHGDRGGDRRLRRRGSHEAFGCLITARIGPG